MPEITRGNRFIPFRKNDLIEMGLYQGPLAEAHAAEVRELCRLLEALLHFEYHQLLEKLKEAYAPFNPDADTRRLHSLDGDALRRRQAAFIQEMTTLLNAANFEKITPGDLADALKERSLFKIRLSVDFNDFEVDDALGKLARWGLLHHEGERMQVLAPADAKVQLDRIWDAYFDYPSSGQDGDEPTAGTVPI